MKSENKKVRNATITAVNGITFKSKLEKMAYNCLLKFGFKPQYEPKTFVLIDEFIPKTPFYDKESDSKFKKRRDSGDKTSRKLVLKNERVQSIKYTPDFYIKYKSLNVYIEMKGIENDVHYIKKKLFRRYLDSLTEPSIYFEVYTKTQLLQAIEIIKEYECFISRENKETDSMPAT